VAVLSAAVLGELQCLLSPKVYKSFYSLCITVKKWFDDNM
jgi:hypothetical protein